jgi:hypothetical protein
MAGFVAVAFVPDTPAGENSTAAGVSGALLLVGLALLLIGLPVRAVLVRLHRRAGRPIPSLGGQYADAAWQPPIPAQRRHHVGHLAGGSGIIVVIALWFLVICGISVGALVEGLHHHDIRHAKDALIVTATLERDTVITSGRVGDSYEDDLTYSVDGHSERDVMLSVGDAEQAGQTRQVIVDVSSPRDPIEAANTGVGEIVGGSCGVAVAIVLLIGAVAAVQSRRKRARQPLPS